MSNITEELTMFVSVHQGDWDNSVKSIICAHDALENTTGHFPYFPFYGREFFMPNETILGTLQSSEYENLSAYVQQFTGALASAHEVAKS